MGISRRYLCVAAVLLFGGCASAPPDVWVKAYDGRELPDRQLASISYLFFRTGERIEIDGKAYSSSTAWEVMHLSITPGVHRIGFIKVVRGMGYVYGTCEGTLSAGHRYTLVVDTQDVGGFWKTEYVAQVYLMDVATKVRVMCELDR